jgi:hypothetical protein
MNLLGMFRFQKQKHSRLCCTDFFESKAMAMAIYSVPSSATPQHQKVKTRLNSKPISVQSV